MSCVEREVTVVSFFTLPLLSLFGIAQDAKALSGAKSGWRNLMALDVHPVLHLSHACWLLVSSRSCYLPWSAGRMRSMHDKYRCLQLTATTRGLSERR
jgi:hypothetical protein